MDSRDTDSTGEWADTLPGSFPVGVLMAREPVTGNPWVDSRWIADGVVTGRYPAGCRQVRQSPERDEYLFGGFEVRLFRDECESYYHNLRAPKPECYVLLSNDEDSGEPRPFRISLSFDEAHAYLEGEDVDLQSVDMPPELYRWVEAFVLAHYVPTPRKKRKRTDWRNGRDDRS